MKKINLLILSAILSVAAFASAAAINRNARAADCVKVVVTESDIVRQAENTAPTGNWVLFTRNAGSGAFRSGPATPPSGVGSFETVTPTVADKVGLFNYEHRNTRLGDIDKMSYATFRAASATDTDAQLPAINIEVDYNGANFAGGYAVLVFEPVYNTNQGNIRDDVWQQWDAYDGGQAVWWSTRDIRDADNNLVLCNPNGAAANTAVCAGKVFVPWSYITTNFPAAVIGGNASYGGFGISQGSGNPALKASSDALTIGSTVSGDSNCFTYDFEPYRVATSKEQCKNGAFAAVKRADGTSFKNQGECVSYVSSGK